VLAEIPPRSSPDLRTGTLRRCDLEAFGGLLAGLGDARTVLMTGSGAHPRQAAVGLATAAAAAGSLTALLESDLADPGLAEALGLATAPGLQEHLAGAADAAAVLKPVVLAGPGSAGATEPLVCVVAGRPSAEGARLFVSDEFVRALAGLRDSYELLVIAGPRLDDRGSLSVLIPQVDATIACLGAGEQRDLDLQVTGLVIQRS